MDAIFEEVTVVAKSVRIPDDVVRERDKLVASGVCLGCKDKQIEGTQMRQGLCPACYTSYRRYYKKGKVTQTELLRSGQLLPRQLGGRPPKNSFTKELRDR